MNTKEMLRALSKHFSGYVCHASFLEEFYRLLKNELSGKETQIFKQLATQLENIKNMGRMVHMADRNERLKGSGNRYYSIHLSSSQYNVRILVYITESGTPYFLSVFYERAGKKRSEYARHIAVLDERLKQLLGGA